MMEVLEYLLRPERPADHFEVEAVTRAAFWTADVPRNPALAAPGMPACDEHLLVHNLRRSTIWEPRLAWLAERQGQTIGSIMYSRATLLPSASMQKPETESTATGSGLLMLAPLSVLPAYQGKGVGGALVEHTLAEARQLGYRGVLLFGSPAYYPRFGFGPAARYGLQTEQGENPEAFMAAELYPGALDDICGRLAMDPVFTVDAQALLKFDKKFPPPSPHSQGKINR